MREYLYLIIPGSILLLFVAMYVYDYFSKSTFMCRTLGWHKAPHTQGFDGCSKNGCCPRCGKEVMLDSQGNWF